MSLNCEINAIRYLCVIGNYVKIVKIALGESVRQNPTRNFVTFVLEKTLFIYLCSMYVCRIEDFLSKLFDVNSTWNSTGETIVSKFNIGPRTKGIVLVLCVHTPREERFLTCSNTKGIFQGFALYFFESGKILPGFVCVKCARLFFYL